MKPEDTKRIEEIKANRDCNYGDDCALEFLLRVIEELQEDLAEERDSRKGDIAMCTHLRQENEWMRKAIDAGVAKLIAGMKHWERCDEREATQEVVESLLLSLTPTPAVETKPNEGETK